MTQYLLPDETKWRPLIFAFTNEERDFVDEQGYCGGMAKKVNKMNSNSDHRHRYVSLETAQLYNYYI